MADNDGPEFPPITELRKAERRVIGVLVEKAFTTPDQYPLTLKSLTSGCNQKSNRDPVANYSEDNVLDTLEQLQERGLIGEVHTESGRSLRYRHYMRHRFSFSEPQLAIVTELLLRGRQRLGELRTRASRMVAIETLEQLRSELRGLMEQGFAQANDDLERRGTEVDHDFYRENENMKLTRGASATATPEPSIATPAPVFQETGPQVTEWEASLDELRSQNRELREELESVKDELQRLSNAFDDLRRDLGG